MFDAETEALAGTGALARRADAHAEAIEHATARVAARAGFRREPVGAQLVAGVITNPKSHRNHNRIRDGIDTLPGVALRAPRTQLELAEVLIEFAQRRIELLVVDGGDGTIRDVLSLAREAFGARMPRIAILPSGKTNALAIDLGIPLEWSVEEVLAAHRAGRWASRTPIEVVRPDGGRPPLRGFLLGAGAFVRATEMAQHTHRLGAFNGVAVGLSLVLAIGQSLLGSARNPWRRGEQMQIVPREEPAAIGAHYLLFASTLEKLPLGLKPFGRIRAGMKLLAVAAPPRNMLISVPAILTGSEAPWLARAGYRRIDTDEVGLKLEKGFILDGEHYPGGRLTLRRGAPVEFVIP